MKASPVHVIVATALFVALTGCAAPQPDAATDTPAVTAPSDAPAADAKPTAAPGAPCFEANFGVSADEEQHGGDVTWPSPLNGDDIGVEPSCWFDELNTERNLFLAGWYGLDDAQYDLVNAPIEGALVDAGYSLRMDTDGISLWQIDLPETPGFQITRTDGFYELAVTIGRG